MYVGDSGGAERIREILAIKLRIVSRARDGAHVDDARDAVCFQQSDEFADRSRGVTDRENERFGIFGPESGPRLSSRLPLAHLRRPFPDCAFPARSRHGYFSS